MERMAMRSRSRALGNLSLGVMVTGTVALEALIHFHVISGAGWRILATGFEAGMVGALADWYAVRAMFHHVPIPILGRHTNILVRNRARITDAIVDAVQNKWLSPQAISQFLEQQSPSTLVMDHFAKEEHQKQLFDALRKVLHGVVTSADTTQAQQLLEQVIADQLRTINIAPVLGKGLVEYIEADRHHAMWESALATLERTTADAHTQEMISGVLQRAVTRYAHSGTIRRMGRKVMEAVGVIDYNAMADAALTELRQFVKQARNNPSHPLRQKMDRALLVWAHDLQAGRGNAAEQLNQWRDRLVDQAELGPIVQSMLGRLRQTMSDQLHQSQGRLMPVIEGFLRDQLTQLQQDHQRQARMDEWIRLRVPELVTRYSHVIGEVVRGKLAAAADAQWVREIEENVGDDLQYIRLNGAVVGFGVGLILALLRWLLLPPIA